MEEKRRVRLGEFEIIERIGSGGMGQVFKALQVPLDRIVALKLLPKNMARDRALVERLYREAKAAAKIMHPNVVQIYSVGEEHGVPYFAMEYVEGVDLERRLDSAEHLTLNEVIDVVAAVVMALSAAAEHGIVHRDIKPGNIMIDKNGVVKVTDFGLAKPTATDALNITQAGYIVGTPTYMSPEQAEGGKVDGRSDIYSLGIVFYELLTGTPPFMADTPAALIYKHVHEPPAPPSGHNPQIPPEVDAVVLHCLAKQPEERYQTPMELLRELLETRRALGVDVGSTIVFDAAQARKWAGMTPRPAVETQVATKGEEEPVEARRGLPVLTALVAASAVAVFVLAAGVTAFLHKSGFFGAPPPVTPGGRPPAAPTDVEPAPAPAGVEPAPVTVDFSFLSGALPDGAAAMLLDGANVAPLPFGPTALQPGQYTIRIEHKGYGTKMVKMTLTAAGPELPMQPATFALEPLPALVSAYQQARDAFEAGEYQKSLEALQVVAQYDAGFQNAAELAGKARGALDAYARERDEQWRKAGDFFKHELYEDAITMLKAIGADNPRFAEAQELIKTAQSALAELARARTAVESGLRTGDLGLVRQELARIEQMAGERPQEKHFSERARSSLQELERLWSDYEKASDDGGRQRLLLAILKAAPDCKRAKDELAPVEERLGRWQRALGLFGSAKDAFEKGAFEECREYVRQSLEVWPQAADARKQLAERARLAIVGRELKSRLPALEAGLLGAAVPAGVLAESLTPATLAAWKQDLAVSDASIALESFSEAEGEIRGRVKFAFQVTEPLPRLAVSCLYTVTFTPAGYLVKAMTLENGQTSGALEESGQVHGRVKSMNGALVTVEVADASSIPIGAGFQFYSQGKVYKLPMSEQVFLEAPQLVGEGRVVSRANDCVVVDTGAPLDGLEAGGVAVYDPRLAPGATPPRLLAARADKAEAHTAEPVTVTLEVADLENRPAAFRWYASGGVFRSNTTAQPEATWMAPAEPGNFTVKAELLHRGRITSSAHVAIRGKGPRGTLPPKYAIDRSMLVGGGVFGGLADLCFDEHDRPTLLDDNGRAAALYDTGFRQMLARHSLGRYAPRKIAVRDGLLYELDGREGRVVALRLPEAGSRKEPQVVKAFGRKGTGNGALVQPVDFALLQGGELAVVDASTQALMVFAADGRFRYSVGSPGKAAGQLDKPVAVAADCAGDLHVLDVGRGVILVYRGVRVLAETILPSADSPAMDLAYSAPLDVFYVLFRSGKVAALRDGHWRTVATPDDKLGGIKEPLAIAADRTGAMYVVHARGQALERFDGNGQFSGRLGGRVLNRPNRVACSPDGGLYLLDSDDKTVAKIDTAGFLMRYFGGRQTFGTPVDLAVNAVGDVLVLDEKAKQVLVFDGNSGQHKGALGTPGRVPAKEIVLPVDLGVVDDAVLLLQDTGRHCVQLYSSAGQLAASFPGKTDEALSVVLAAAADTNKRIFVAQKGQPVFIYSLEGGLLGKGRKRFSRVVDAEVAPDGTLVLLDDVSRLLCMAMWDGAELKEMVIDLGGVTTRGLDVATDRFGGTYLLTGDQQLLRFAPVWE